MGFQLYDTYNTVETVADVGTMLFADFGMQHKQASSQQASTSKSATMQTSGRVVKGRTTTGNDVYAGVKEASEFLKSQNVPRE